MGAKVCPYVATRQHLRPQMADVARMRNGKGGQTARTRTSEGKAECIANQVPSESLERETRWATKEDDDTTHGMRG